MRRTHITVEKKKCRLQKTLRLATEHCDHWWPRGGWLRERVGVVERGYTCQDCHYWGDE